MDNTFFPRRLAEERKARGYTQKQVADALGISDRTYSKWETGENEMDVSALCRLAEFYETSPAIFFPSDKQRPEGVRKALAAMSPGEAAKSWFKLHADAFLGMFDASNAWYREDPTRQFVYGEPLPGLEAPAIPAELAGRPGGEAVRCSFDCPDLMGLIAAGKDANLSLLMLPHEDKYAWMESEAERLEALFRTLSLPGAGKCLRFLLAQGPGRYFSAPYLAGKAGADPEEAEVFLRAAAAQHLAMTQTVRREGREETLYCAFFQSELVGILTLAYLMLTRAGRYARMGGTGGRLPSAADEKGENE